MCRIAGLAGASDPALVTAMCRIQQHGGPDDERVQTFGACTLGNRRLAIVDVAHGQQPLANEDGSIWVTFNGEIYNHLDLRAALEEEGHTFRTHSDTEVLVHAYEAWGDALLGKLNGIFAFALWDENRKRMLLARDPLGVKPLHYTHFPDGTLAFASEVKALLLHPRLERRLDAAAARWFLDQWFVPGERTLFEGVRRLPAGWAMEWKDGQVRRWQHWRPSLQPSPAPDEEHVRRIQALVEESVARELQGEVPIGVMLSGGMDSSTLVAVMSQHWQGPVHTYTVGFREENEMADARRTAEHFGTRHHELFVQGEAIAHTPRAVWHMDEPKRNIEPTFLLAQEAKREVKVLLSGIGGDELFLGYDKDLRLARTHALPRLIPAPLRRAAASWPMPTDKLEHVRDFVAGADDPAQHYLSFGPTAPLSEREQQAILGPRLQGQPHVREAYRPAFQDLQGEDFADAALLVQLRTYAADDLLAIADRQLSAHGIEGRVPLLNRTLVEAAFRIPLEVRARERKHVLRRAMKRILPKPIVEDMGKRVFGMRSATWFETGLRDAARRILAPERVRKVGLFDADWVQRTLERPADPKRERDYTHLSNLLVFELWRQLYFEQDDVRHPKLDLDAFAA
jgi:asparagine synthase (glutamine-hydrolysing)